MSYPRCKGILNERQTCFCVCVKCKTVSCPLYERGGMGYCNYYSRTQREFPPIEWRWGLPKRWVH